MVQPGRGGAVVSSRDSRGRDASCRPVMAGETKRHVRASRPPSPLYGSVHLKTDRKTIDVNRREVGKIDVGIIDARGQGR